MSYSNLYKNINYKPNVSFVISRYIREYDLSKANISVLLEAGVISQDQYEYYSNLDKQDRECKIGNMIRKYPDIQKTIQDGIIEAKRRLFEANDIQDFEVLCIKNDAVFILDRALPITEFGNLTFSNKNIYTSFYKIGRLEFYYLLDIVNKIERIDIKGMSPSAIEPHTGYFLDFLLTLFDYGQTMPIEDTIALLKNFFIEYISRKLDIQYYRTFDANSVYKFTNIARFADFSAEYLLEDVKPEYLDISCNAEILKEFTKIFSMIYFQQRK